MKENTWVASLKPGDEVAIRGKYARGKDPGWEFATVVRRTPTGRLRLSNGQQVNQDGHIIGTYDNFSGWRSIESVKAYMREDQAERGRLICKLRGIGHQELMGVTNAQMRAALESLGIQSD